eukprot:1110915-Rhodomonas_salina.1
MLFSYATATGCPVLMHRMLLSGARWARQYGRGKRAAWYPFCLFFVLSYAFARRGPVLSRLDNQLDGLLKIAQVPSAQITQAEHEVLHHAVANNLQRYLQVKRAPYLLCSRCPISYARD